MLALSCAARPVCHARLPAPQRRSLDRPAPRRATRPPLPPPRAAPPASGSEAKDPSEEDRNNPYLEWQDIMARLAQWHRIKPKKVIAAAQKNPAVVNLEDDSGWTALHFAAVFGKEETVQGLLEAGADPNWETEEFEEHGTWRGFLPGSTPLHCAADGFIPDAPESGLVDKAKVLKLLLAAGADATAADDAGWTPLHSVALQVRNNNWQWWNGSGGKQLLADMMSALIAAGASLDAADEQGLTPRRLLLQYAVQTMGAAAAAQLTGVPQAELEKLAPGKDFPSW